MTAWQDALRRLAGRATAGLVYGAICGALVGGVGGRLAMLLLRLTSDDRLRGVDTDDGFEIGSFTSGTVFLLVVTTLLGAVVGVLYVGVRRWLPRRLRPLATAVVAGALGGALIVEPDGIDFSALEPLWLAVVLFVTLPAAFGALVSWLLERAVVGERVAPALLLLVPAVLLAVTGVGAIIVTVVALGSYASTRSPELVRVWESPTALWAGRAVLAVGTVLLAADLAVDAREILG